MLEIGMLAIVVVSVLAAFVAIWCIALFIRAVLWVVLLPIKLLLWLVFLPLLLLKLVIGLLIGIVFAPIFAIFGLIVVLTAGVAFLLPLAPFVLIVAAIFWLMKKDRPATTLPARPI
jgi:hypothetical protein